MKPDAIRDEISMLERQREDLQNNLLITEGSLRAMRRVLSLVDGEALYGGPVGGDMDTSGSDLSASLVAAGMNAVINAADADEVMGEAPTDA